MAIISKISAQRKPGRYNIFLDGKYAFSASEKTVAQFILLKGKEISDQDIEKIKRFDLDAKASDLAAHFLSYEPRSIYEVVQYLLQHDISSEAAEAAVKQLSDLGFLDDQKYVQLFLKNNLRVGNDGPKSLARKLKQKGVDAEIIQNEIEAIDQDQWLQVAQRVIKSMKHQVGKYSEREFQQKVKTKLLSHGFDIGLANILYEQLEFKPSEDEQMEALKKQGIRAYKRFRHFDQRERNMKIKRYLFSHGFSSNEIEAFLNGEVISWDELEEY